MYLQTFKTEVLLILNIQTILLKTKSFEENLKNDFLHVHVQFCMDSRLRISRKGSMQNILERKIGRVLKNRIQALQALQSRENNFILNKI